ncbi:NAD(P)/FAD-dependent oxidoreductase [Microbacterium sp. Se5.02b]|uniref:phytoene desaturase family protein n=1 Tax=Microbacterium sp. Se5.02b TaxID=2864103 RepID=UPI001C68C148|nr:NAD(P)/FAD-dependent oxidoreductase [Microbacterium sp. Se5.02b]QYM65308.1 NAD(P)/FAD-dependent oxidoreductase [Microbacterium sp. Se5.02b]
MVRATIIGSGPNGLAAGVALARAGYEVRVLEASDTIGGGVRTAETTLSGFRHDVCSTVHPAALASPFFRAFGLAERLEWIIPEISYAHPLDAGRAAIAWRDIERTAAGLGADERAWLRLLRPLSRRIDGVTDFTGNQLLRVPADPVTAVRYALRMLDQGTPLAARSFRTVEAAALMSGVVAHANSPQPSLAGAAAGLLLAALGHADGWPLPRGGAQSIADALVADLEAHGGSVEPGTAVTDLGALDWGDPGRGDLLLLNTSPRLALTHPDIPAGYRRALASYRYGAAAAKVDFALDGPIPWSNADVRQAITVHLGGTRAEVWASENAVAAGRVSERPYVLAVQPSVVDASRAPEGKAVLWAYIHVPNGSDLDPTALITTQVERFAPGFRDLVLAPHAVPASSREAVNPAEIGGDISGGVFDMRQALRRPALSPTPWRTPMRGIYLASAATPPGPAVSGMAGWHAARTALADAGEPATLDDLFG